MEMVCTVKGLHMTLVCHFMVGRGLQLQAPHLHPGRGLEANSSHLPQLVHLTTINCNKTEQNKSQPPKRIHSFCHLARGLGVVVWLHSPQQVLLDLFTSRDPSSGFHICTPQWQREVQGLWEHRAGKADPDYASRKVSQEK